MLEEEVAGLMYLQDQLETHLSGEDWRDRGHNYQLCIAMECAEAIDHYGYKHWKGQVPDITACRMELVDILHFWLALELVKGGNHEAMAADMFYGMTHLNSCMTFVDAMSGIIGSVSSLGTMPTVNFFTAMDRVDLTWDEMHMLYLIKHTLNVFRRDNGYADGLYIKDWDGIEDNVHAEALGRKIVEADGELMISVLYDELSSAYKYYTTLESRLSLN